MHVPEINIALLCDKAQFATQP